MIVAHITTDNREAFRRYELTEPRFGTAPEAVFAGLARRPEITLHILSCTQRPLRSPEKLGERVWFHSLHVPKFGWLRTGYSGCILALRRRLARIRPDVVHGQGTERECALGAAFGGFPNVVTVHGNMVRVQRLYPARFGSYHWLTARLENLALRGSGGVFCNSAYTEEIVRGRARRLWRVPNAIRELFLEEPPAASPAAVPVLVNAGVIDPLKRQAELLELAARLHAAGHRFELRFAGHFGGDEAYNARFREALQRLPGTAFHDGLLAARELRDWLDRATAMAHVSAEESFGLAVAEGLARNVKLFGFAVGGTTDIVRDVPSAELVPDADWAALESAIGRWLRHGSGRPSDGAPIMRRRYHPDAIAEQHVEIYHEVMAMKTGGFSS